MNYYLISIFKFPIVLTLLLDCIICKMNVWIICLRHWEFFTACPYIAFFIKPAPQSSFFFFKINLLEEDNSQVLHKRSVSEYPKVISLISLFLFSLISSFSMSKWSLSKFIGSLSFLLFSLVFCVVNSIFLSEFSTIVLNLKSIY